MLNSNELRLIAQTRSLLVLVVVVLGGYVLGAYVSDHQTAAMQTATDDLAVHVDTAVTKKIPLIRHDGILVEWASTGGNLRMVMFGYTFCPDICPLGLSNLAETIDLLEQRGVAITPIFVTVDPNRDTADVLGEYVPLFHEKMVGFTGSEASIKKLATAFKAVYMVPEEEVGDEFYLVDHTSSIYLINEDGLLLDLFAGSAQASSVADRVVELTSPGT